MIEICRFSRPYRARPHIAMFGNIDRFIVLGRCDRPDIIPAWRQALADRGCGGRILAELTSESPDSQPECLQLQSAGPLLHARIRGLDRNHPRERIAAALTDLTARLIDILPICP